MMAHDNGIPVCCRPEIGTAHLEKDNIQLGLENLRLIKENLAGEQSHAEKSGGESGM
jgi:hypothetical protein